MKNAYDIVKDFEAKVAEYAGSNYAVAVDSCTSAILLSCEYYKVQEVTLPTHTYISVPFAVIHAGGTVKFEDADWSGVYQLKPYPIIDGALRFRKGMYQKGFLQCLSFHYQKTLDIGRGGIILTDDEDTAKWLKKMRYDGRNEVALENDDVEMVGWRVYMEPERAARGLSLMDIIPDDNEDLPVEYPDISKFTVFK